MELASVTLEDPRAGDHGHSNSLGRDRVAQWGWRRSPWKVTRGRPLALELADARSCGTALLVPIALDGVRGP